MTRYIPAEEAKANVKDIVRGVWASSDGGVVAIRITTSGAELLPRAALTASEIGDVDTKVHIVPAANWLAFALLSNQPLLETCNRLWEKRSERPGRLNGRDIATIKNLPANAAHVQRASKIYERIADCFALEDAELKQTLLRMFGEKPSRPVAPPSIVSHVTRVAAQKNGLLPQEISSAICSMQSHLNELSDEVIQRRLGSNEKSPLDNNTFRSIRSGSYNYPNRYGLERLRALKAFFDEYRPAYEEATQGVSAAEKVDLGVLVQLMEAMMEARAAQLPSTPSASRPRAR